ADELLYRTTVRLDDSLHPIEIAGEESAQSLRVGRLPKAGRTNHVAEQHRHCLALLTRACGHRQRRGALLAELPGLVVLVAALGADQHEASVRPTGTHCARALVPSTGAELDRDQLGVLITVT